MKIIPVIDLMGAQVVHARKGERSRYQPLVSTLCRSTQPEVVVAALRNLHPFHRLYIADLDAIRGTGDNLKTILRINRHFTDLQIWLDNGIRSVSDVNRCLNLGFARPVIGSETLHEVKLLQTLKNTASAHQSILSLDYLGDQFLGPAQLETVSDLWPSKVILMTLSRVGSHRGPALEQLRQLRQFSPRTELYAAGGIRNADDLSQVSALGVKGALVASALHDGGLTLEVLSMY
jgi:phosphoribosylformimino-5-aminoimidazole carboxamide ribotide isomerase